MKSWSEIEVKALLSLIEEKRILEKIDTKRQRNQVLFQGLEESLKELKINYSWKQIRSKWKNLKSLYYKEVQLSSRSGASAPTSPFFDSMKNLLHERPRVQGLQGKLPCVDTSADVQGAVEVIIDTEECSADEKSFDSSSFTRKEDSSFEVKCGSEEQSDELPHCSKDDGSQERKSRKRKLLQRQRDHGKVAALAEVFEKQAEKDRESRKELFQAINKTLQEGFDVILKKPPVVINFPNAEK